MVLLPGDYFVELLHDIFTVDLEQDEPYLLLVFAAGSHPQLLLLALALDHKQKPLFLVALRYALHCEFQAEAGPFVEVDFQVGTVRLEQGDFFGAGID